MRCSRRAKGRFILGRFRAIVKMDGVREVAECRTENNSAQPTCKIPSKQEQFFSGERKLTAKRQT